MYYGWSYIFGPFYYELPNKITVFYLRAAIFSCLRIVFLFISCPLSVFPFHFALPCTSRQRRRVPHQAIIRGDVITNFSRCGLALLPWFGVSGSFPLLGFFTLHFRSPIKEFSCRNQICPWSQGVFTNGKFI